MATTRSQPPEPLALAGHTDQQFRQRFLWLTAARVLVATLIFGGTVGVYLAEGSGLEGPTPRLLLAVVIAVYGCSLGYALQLRQENVRRLRVLASVSIVLDLLAWTALAYATGGAGSPLSSFFGLSTLAAAIVIGGNSTLWTAIGALGLYGALGVLMATGVLPPLPDMAYANPNVIEITYQMVVTVTAVVLITAIGGSLADRLSITGDALVRAEVSRAALAALYEDVLRSIPVAILTYNADGKVNSANPKAAELLRTDASALLGMDARALLPFVPGMVFEGGKASGDAKLEAQGSAAVPIAFRAAPLYDRDGMARGGLVVVEDRSEEEELRTAVETAERFAVLGRLAAGLAHEIRNPLGAISGCVELVRETAKLDPEDRQLLTTVTRDVARLNDLVTDMLRFARPRPPELRATDLVDLAREVVTMARTSGGPESKMALGLEGDASVTANVDGAQIRQVLWNLVRNAVQASRAGGEVTIGVHSLEDTVELTVADRGPGIKPEIRERIFESFYSDTARGTGLGLAIVKRIADSHHAGVEVRARAGGGSVFVVSLPKRPPRPSERPGPPPPSETETILPRPVE